MGLHEITVSLTPLAAGHFDQLSPDAKKKAGDYVKRLRADGLGGATPLRHVNGLIWRKKLGDIRVLFTYDVRNRVIIVRAILWRREGTYDDVNSLALEAEIEKKNRQSASKAKKGYQQQTRTRSKKETKQK
jgi:mRNA-degrading endonuclease RelE of RelBE toxin-antitoxin system